MTQVNFDFTNPDYGHIFKARAERLNALRQNPEGWDVLKNHYRFSPVDMIMDWGCTFDPRNSEKGLPNIIPFILFPRQREWIEWCYEQWQNQGKSATVKSRDMGLSWLSVAFAVCMCSTNRDMVIGFGSRKEDYVDKQGDPKSLFWKARMFASLLPEELRGGFHDPKTSPHLRIGFPSTGSYISGEAGDGIGRGDRTSIYFVDEAAFLQRPQLIEASLSQTTNCRIDISTPNGLGNPFAEKVQGGQHEVFTFHWSDDPRKDQAWYDKQKKELDPVTVAQEIDIDFSASIEGVIIAGKYVRAAIDAHTKVTPKDGRWTGTKILGYDVADDGGDTNANCVMNGSVCTFIEEWHADEDELTKSTARTRDNAISHRCKNIGYDSIGIGAGVGAILNNMDWSNHYKFNAGETVFDPDGEYTEDKLNKEHFSNLKAQSWWLVASKFRNTYRAINEGVEFDACEMISISTNIPARQREKLIKELSTPLMTYDSKYRVKVEGKKELKKRQVKSPNLADAFIIACVGSMLVKPTMGDIL